MLRLPQRPPCPAQPLLGGTAVALPRWHGRESGLGGPLLTHGPGARSQDLSASAASSASEGEQGEEGETLQTATKEEHRSPSLGS